MALKEGGFLYRARIILGTVSGYMIGMVMTAFLTVITAPVALLNLTPVYKLIAFFWSRFVFWIFLRPLHVSGRNHLVKHKRYLVISNHSSYFDIPALMSLLPGISWVARESLFRIPVFGLVMKKIGCIAIDSKNFLKSSKSIEQATDKANSDRSVGIFPEGTRSPDGKMRDFKRGFTRILRMSDLDILPVTLNGFYTLWPKGSFFVNPSKKLEIIIHKPLSREELVKKTDAEIIAEVRKIIEGSCKFW